jgi:hypothetical protein
MKQLIDFFLLYRTNPLINLTVAAIIGALPIFLLQKHLKNQKGFGGLLKLE